MDDGFGTGTVQAGGPSSMVSARAYDASALMVLQETDNVVLNSDKMRVEGMAASFHRMWGIDTSVEGMEHDPRRGYMSYPMDKRHKYHRLSKLPGCAVGARLVPVIEHLRLQGLALQVAIVSHSARAALAGFFQMGKHFSHGMVTPTGTEAEI